MQTIERVRSELKRGGAISEQDSQITTNDNTQVLARLARESGNIKNAICGLVCTDHARVLRSMLEGYEQRKNDAPMRLLGFSRAFYSHGRFSQLAESALSDSKKNSNSEKVRQTLREVEDALIENVEKLLTHLPLGKETIEGGQGCTIPTSRIIEQVVSTLTLGSKISSVSVQRRLTAIGEKFLDKHVIELARANLKEERGINHDLGTYRDVLTISSKRQEVDPDLLELLDNLEQKIETAGGRITDLPGRIQPREMDIGAIKEAIRNRNFEGYARLIGCSSVRYGETHEVIHLSRNLAESLDDLREYSDDAVELNDLSSNFVTMIREYYEPLLQSVATSLEEIPEEGTTLQLSVEYRGLNRYESLLRIARNFDLEIPDELQQKAAAYGEHLCNEFTQKLVKEDQAQQFHNPEFVARYWCSDLAWIFDDHCSVRRTYNVLTNESDLPEEVTEKFSRVLPRRIEQVSACSHNNFLQSFVNCGSRREERVFWGANQRPQFAIDGLAAFFEKLEEYAEKKGATLAGTYENEKESALRSALETCLTRLRLDVGRERATSWGTYINQRSVFEYINRLQQLAVKHLPQAMHDEYMGKLEGFRREIRREHAIQYRSRMKAIKSGIGFKEAPYEAKRLWEAFCDKQQSICGLEVVARTVEEMRISGITLNDLYEARKRSKGRSVQEVLDEARKG